MGSPCTVPKGLLLRADSVIMADVTSSTLERHAHRARGVQTGPGGSDESDIEVVTDKLGTDLGFNPLGESVAKCICAWLDVQYEACLDLGSVSHIGGLGGLGPPCSNVEIPGDGNCFFRAVSKAVSGTDSNHGALRQATVTRLESAHSEYGSILRNGYSSVADYISRSRMGSLCTWATEVEIQALADHMGVSIYTYHKEVWLRYACNKEPIAAQGIYLENCGNHYETVVCVKKPDGKSCYGHCKPRGVGNGVTRGPSWYSDSSSDCEDGEEMYVDCDSESQEDYGQETYVYGDYEDYDEAKYEREQEQLERRLEWSVLNRSWHSLLEWLGDNWWGGVSEEQIVSYLDAPEGHVHMRGIGTAGIRRPRSDDERTGSYNGRRAHAT
ncbi:hypothetical protein KUCAC02_025123 [Chaenocephalus aceratus]|nr:hypothetical protein KUCAC02_025123 [Chaenocephalus aceratus]